MLYTVIYRGGTMCESDHHQPWRTTERSDKSAAEAQSAEAQQQTAAAAAAAAGVEEFGNER